MKKEKTNTRWILASFLSLLLLGFGAYYGIELALEHNPLLNFGVVEEGKIYRSAQPLSADFKELVEKYRIKTVVCLRTKEEDEIIELAKDYGIKVIVMKLSKDKEPTDLQIELFFKIMKGKAIDLKRYKEIISYGLNTDSHSLSLEFPVLVHCQGGADRTGLMIALYRITFENKSKREAKLEMARYGHIFIFTPMPYRFIDKFDASSFLRKI